MADQQQPLLNRIVVSRDICHGKPRIDGTRVMVHQVLGLLAAGKSIDEITSSEYFPDITPDDVLACLAYASRIVENDTVIPTA
ncbi:MAG: DUF433 domain-containing protein [Chloroflexi bacterium]|nr:DUF433 domain-containing protein [Chloroflexota bacterium]